MLKYDIFQCSGSRSGYIHHHDVRVAEHQVGSLGGHTQEICGLKWSPDGRYLASGGNDNLLNIWPQVVGQHYTETSPLYTFSHHQAAVKVSSLLLVKSSKLSHKNISRSIWGYVRFPQNSNLLVSLSGSGMVSMATQSVSQWRRYSRQTYSVLELQCGYMCQSSWHEITGRQK